MSANTLTRHVIQEGESLSQIAQKYGVTAQEIRNFHNTNAPLPDLMGTEGNFTNEGQLNYALIPSKEESDSTILTEEPPESVSSQPQNSEENTAEEGQETSKGETSEHDQKYVVIQKGYCVCDQSIPPNMVPVQFKVDSHQLQHANGEEQDHLIVTEEDVFFQKSSQPFGPQCKLQPNSSSYNPCSYAPAGKWQKTYSKIQVLEKPILTELSELQCAIGGKITVFQHGQSQKVTNAHFGNVELEEMQAISPLAEKPELETPKVKRIRALTKTTINSPDKVTIRLGEKVKFEISEWYNEQKADKSLTSWEVLSSGNKKTDWNSTSFLKHTEFGSTIELEFDTVGNYRVFAFGNEASKKDNSCVIDIQVVINQLQKKTNGIKTVGNHFSGKDIRRGFPVNFQPDFELTATQEELDRVEMGVKDAQGNLVESNFSPSTGLIFTPANAIKYKVWIRYTQQDGVVQTFENQYEARPNVVNAIQASPSAEKFRPGTTINFSVSKMRFSPIENDPDYANIKWNVNGITAPERGKTFSKRFDQPANYVVEAFMNSADGKNDDTFTFEIVKNSVHKIGIEKHPKAGSYGEFKIEKFELADYLMSKDGELKWVIEGPTPGIYMDEEYIEHKFTKAGNYTISCFMGTNSCKEPLEIEVKQAVIKTDSSKWIDKDSGSGNVIKKAGYGQTVCAYVDYEGLEKEQVYLDVYDDDSTGDNVVYSIQGELTGKTGMYWPLKLSDEVKKKIQEKGLASYGDLYFKIRPLEPDLKVINGHAELGKHLRVSETPEIINAYFTDAGDKQKLRFCKQNEKLYFKVYATNYVGKKVKVHFITVSDGYYRWKGMQLQDWEDIQDYFKNENFFHSEEITFNENGEILIEVPLSKLGTPKKHFLINGAIEILAEEGKKAKGVYVEMADRAFIFKTNANAEELKNAPAPLIVDRVNIDTGGKKENEIGICECEAKVRAFMRMLRVKEGTEGDSGYEKIVGGKSFIKDHGKDWSTHPDIDVYIKRIGSSSDAAGAYQMMNYTYNDNRMKKYRKQYNVTSFNPESQDKMCLIILKYFYREDRIADFYNTGNSSKDNWRKRFKGQQGDIIQFIIDDNFNRAVLLASLCWASLPDSPYGQQSSSYTNEDVRKIYDNYLKEELEGKSDLYLKKGFLKEFEYYCCNDNPQEKGICSSCNQNHFELADDTKWQTQFSDIFGDSKKQKVACWRACKVVLNNYGVTGGDNVNPIQMVKQNGSSLELKNIGEGKNYLDQQLANNKVILVGVDDGRSESYNTDDTTEHFIVIVGKGCDNGKIFYRYFDVGTSHKNKGTAETNKLFLESNGIIKGKSPGGTKTYTIAQVRRNS